MWVTTTCSTGKGEGQAGCDWQSDTPPLSFISNLSNAGNTGSIFYFTPGHCKLASAFDSFSHFFSYLFCLWHSGMSKVKQESTNSSAAHKRKCFMSLAPKYKHTTTVSRPEQRHFFQAEEDSIQ